jgi:hypothetical protein
MRYLFLKYFFLGKLAVGAAMLFPVRALAHTPSVGLAALRGPLVSCTGLGCTNLCDLAHTAVHFIYFGISLALLGFAPVLLVWGGLMVILGGASPGQIDRGKKVIWGTIIGIAVVLLSFQIVDWVYLAATGSSIGSIQCDLPEVVLPPSETIGP